MRDFAFMCPTMDFVTRGDATYDGVPVGSYISPNVVNPDGTYGEVLGGKDTNDGFWGTTIGNMYAKQMELNKRNRPNRALASAYLTVTPLKGLSWKTLVSYDYTGNSDTTSARHQTCKLLQRNSHRRDQRNKRLRQSEQRQRL